MISASHYASRGQAKWHLRPDPRLAGKDGNRWNGTTLKPVRGHGLRPSSLSSPLTTRRSPEEKQIIIIFSLTLDTCATLGARDYRLHCDRISENFGKRKLTKRNMEGMLAHAEISSNPIRSVGKSCLENEKSNDLQKKSQRW
ncbi:Coiled-coil domain-containing protein 127 [Anopheles sinensis]|uniref:Coiled-coil domain-containing protein 127 n=1 Tax=Anopheles sinensis TaxID=74873 RepID=A0A084WHL1_ANOSI|nr:Coiled-coil domain-containing protein 127 [Anopheles sinensis]